MCTVLKISYFFPFFCQFSLACYLSSCFIVSVTSPLVNRRELKGQEWWKRNQLLRMCYAFAKFSWKLGKTSPLLGATISILGMKHLHSGVRVVQGSMGTRFEKSCWPITQQPQGEQWATEPGIGNTSSGLALCRGSWLPTPSRGSGPH